MVKYSSLERGFPAGSPLASALVIIVGALAIAASIVVGFFAFVILGSLLLVLAAVVSIRLWWFRRKMTRNPAFQASANDRATGAQETIEGEYHVVIEERKDRQG
jgi:membrane protein implicated in regulation of membrane protease activity